MSVEPSGAGRLLSCDLVCLGVGSPGVWRGFTEWLGAREGSAVTGYRHRPKDGEGVPLGREAAQLADGREDAESRDVRKWNRLYGGRQVMRPSCHGCAFHSTRRAGQVTIGDFWGLDPASPLADGRGTSVVLESAPGGELAGALAGAMELEPRTVTEAANVERQPTLSEPSWVAATRERVFEADVRGGFAAVSRELDRQSLARRIRRLFARGAEPAHEDPAAVLDAPVLMPDGSVLENRLVSRKGDCCGCTACMAACPVDAIQMAEDAEGFKYPAIDGGRCVGCGRCERACGHKRALADPGAIGPTDEPLVFAAKHRDDEVRRRSSSGGAFWALAEHVVGGGGVVYGCAFDEHLVARHVRCETLEECRACQGSKYSQSDMGETFSKVRSDLRAGRTVLFTGTPCQVYGLRCYLETCGGGRGSLICADIICHGTPSPLMWREHLAFLAAREGSAVARYEHRPKSTGWGHVERVWFADGTSQQGTRLSDSWRRLFYGNRALRPSCRACAFTRTRRASDLTIADFWGIENTDLADFRDDLGVSLILVNTPAGEALLGELDMEVRESSLADALPRNPMLERPSIYAGSREELWALYREHGYEGMLRRMHYYPSVPRYVAGKVKRKLKGLLGR